MDLSTALDEAMEESHRPVTECSVGLLLDRLPEPDAAKLAKALDEPMESGEWLPATRIAQILRQNGEDIASTTLSRHRRRGDGSGCKCPT
jgi:hypothetical protein